MKTDKATLSKTIGKKLNQLEIRVLLDQNLDSKIRYLKKERKLIIVLLDAV